MYKKSEGLEYAVDVTVSYCLVKGIGDCKDAELFIPAEYKGLPVVGIANNAFKGCNSITKIILSEGIRMICPGAFSECKDVTEVYLPDGLISVGDMAFSGCQSLKSIRIPRTADRIGKHAMKDCIRLSDVEYGGTKSEWKETGTEYSWDENTGSYTVYCKGGQIKKPSARYILLDRMGRAGHYKTVPFVNRKASDGLEYTESDDGKSLYVVGIGCCTDTEIYVPAKLDGKNVTQIGKKAFKDNESITSVDLPFGIEVIGSSSFSGCKNLKSISIPESIYVIENGAFIGCTSLGYVTLGNNVCRIAPHTFMGCSALCDVSIPDSVESIGMSAFEDCTALSSVTLPCALSHVGLFAFRGCNLLKNIFYPKSKSEWQTEVTDEANTEVICKDRA